MTFFEPIENENKFDLNLEQKKMEETLDVYNANISTFSKYEKMTDDFKKHWYALTEVLNRTKTYVYTGMFRFRYDYFIKRVTEALKSQDKIPHIRSIAIALLDDMKALDKYKEYRKEKDSRENKIKFYTSLEDYKKAQQEKRKELEDEEERE